MLVPGYRIFQGVILTPHFSNFLLNLLEYFNIYFMKRWDTLEASIPKYLSRISNIVSHRHSLHMKIAVEILSKNIRGGGQNEPLCV